jgi:hypothetical protein
MVIELTVKLLSLASIKKVLVSVNAAGPVNVAGSIVVKHCQRGSYQMRRLATSHCQSQSMQNHTTEK